MAWPTAVLPPKRHQELRRSQLTNLDRRPTKEQSMLDCEHSTGLAHPAANGPREASASRLSRECPGRFNHGEPQRRRKSFPKVMLANQAYRRPIVKVKKITVAAISGARRVGVARTTRQTYPAPLFQQLPFRLEHRVTLLRRVCGTFIRLVSHCADDGFVFLRRLGKRFL